MAKGMKQSFHQVLSKYDIVIPRIQRDYVQGRNQKRVQEALEVLLSDIKNAIFENKPLDLNFIYGQVKKGEGSKRGEFPPIDGQQRLTTLFLLHLYSFWSAKDEENFRKLKKFQYKTRPTTTEFLERLLQLKGDKLEDEKETFFYDSYPSKKEAISEWIVDQSWFQAEWKYNPTIKSMLFVLNRIHSIFGSLPKFSEELTKDDCKITFWFLGETNIKADDELYIKLNARGKELSEFEVFKAELEDSMDEDSLEMFIKNMDVKWANYFWKVSRPETHDNVMMHFFHLLLFCQTAITNKYDIKTFNKDLYTKTEYFILEDYNINLNDIVPLIIRFMQWLCEQEEPHEWLIKVLNIKAEEEISEEESEDEEISEYKGVLEYVDVAKFFALYVFSNKAKTNSLGVWERVVNNLLNNTEFNEGNFTNILASIVKLGNRADDMLNYLSNEDVILTGIDATILEEEKRKAKLILESPQTWEQPIYEAEKIKYLNGQIVSLLDFAEGDINKFCNYIEKFNYIFADEGIKNEEITLFRRALLSMGNYILKDSFLINGARPRDCSWRTLLNNHNDGKRDILKTLIDRLDIEKDKKEQLRQIIENSCLDINDDWTYFFVKVDGVMEYCKKCGMIRNHAEQFVVVPAQSENNKSNAEYYTFSLLNIMKLDKEKYYQYGWHKDVKGILLNGKIIVRCIDQKHFEVDLRGLKEKWEINEIYELANELINQI